MSKTVRLDDDVHARVRRKKLDDETMSEAIDRLTSGYSLVDFARDDSSDTDRLRDILDEADSVDNRKTARELDIDRNEGDEAPEQ
ncbi:hypothetical protein BRD04_08820 [Halobacteriales archaeon QS_9_67_17]|nr:MAG: hypothetical protein BRD04_08820 [Halobacteriales archaeon QS_9_67_17]